VSRFSGKGEVEDGVDNIKLRIFMRFRVFGGTRCHLFFLLGVTLFSA
jgi:hypothetical protein